jgi:hypothetical protein
LLARVSQECAGIALRIEAIDDTHLPVSSALLGPVATALRLLFADVEDGAASKIVVRASTDDEQLTVTVRIRPPGRVDDGEALARELRRVVDAVYGSVAITSQAGYGLRIEMSMPR